MIDILYGGSRHFDHEIRRDMHRLRHRVFKERMGWDVDSRNGEEHDQFDTENPLYLLSYNDDGDLAGTWRLLPTTGPYMLRDVFDHLLEGMPPPARPTIWETSRFAVDVPAGQRAAAEAVSRTCREMFCGLVEFGVATGIDEIITVYDLRIARLLNWIGVKPHWQSGRHKIGATTAMAGRFYVNVEVLENLRQASGLTESVLRHVDWPSLPEAA